jgi:subtilisin family serine protease
MYAKGQILVREPYLQRVAKILNQPDLPDEEIWDPPPGTTPRAEPVLAGVVLLRLGFGPDSELSVLDALARIDKVLGPGYATPNHVLTVDGEGGPCPATEPGEVYEGMEPYPSAAPGDAGAGISIYMADTGLIKYDLDAVSAPPHEVVTNVGKPHAWLKGVRGDRDPHHPGHGTRIKPYEGHGTFVAGVARCMAPGAEIYVANAFKVAGSTLETHLARHLDAALAHGYDLFHLSVTAPTRKDLPLLSFEGWLRRLSEYKGVACIVAAGNSSTQLPSWPAAFPQVVSVGALAADWRSRALFSNYGPWVDVYAPGRDLINAFGIGTYRCYTHPYKPQERHFYGMAKWSGTSFSTPVVTGLIAARMSRTGENGQEAAAALLAEARAHAIPGVGAILLPYGDHLAALAG